MVVDCSNKPHLFFLTFTSPKHHPTQKFKRKLRHNTHYQMIMMKQLLVRVIDVSKFLWDTTSVLFKTPLITNLYYASLKCTAFSDHVWKHIIITFYTVNKWWNDPANERTHLSQILYINVCNIYEYMQKEGELWI